MKAKRFVIIGVVLLTLAVIVVVGVCNRAWIYDWWRGMNYAPSEEMATIQGKLGLTGQGEFLFKASWPKLSTREEFNEICRPEFNEEVAVLGCYTEGDIYIYNITEPELDGIRELTTAHELLHAVWARMGESERRQLIGVLNQVYTENRGVFERDLGTYTEDQKLEELFVRAGTEVKNLPATLETVYGEIFTNQDVVVDYYEKYIEVFLAIEAELDELTGRMDELSERIEQMTTEYKRRIAQLNADVVSFNACAEVAGCFKSEEEFYARRGVLVAEQESLNGAYEDINKVVEEYNELVEVYNADVMHSNELNRMINSSERASGV